MDTKKSENKQFPISDTLQKENDKQILLTLKHRQDRIESLRGKFYDMMILENINVGEWGEIVESLSESIGRHVSIIKLNQIIK